MQNSHRYPHQTLPYFELNILDFLQKWLERSRLKRPSMWLTTQRWGGYNWLQWRRDCTTRGCPHFAGWTWIRRPTDYRTNIAEQQVYVGQVIVHRGCLAIIMSVQNEMYQLHFLYRQMYSIHVFEHYLFRSIFYKIYLCFRSRSCVINVTLLYMYLTRKFVFSKWNKIICQFNEMKHFHTLWF